MAPSKWDDEEESTPPSSPPPAAIPRRKFDDEEEDDVVDDWEAAEDSEVEREKAAKAAAEKAKAEAEAAAKKKSKAQRVQELKEKRQRELEEQESDEEEEDAATQRARLRQTEKESDLKHAEDLIGDIDLNRKRSAPKATVISDKDDPTRSIDLSAIPLFKPTTKNQFTELTDTLIPLLTASSKKPHYSLWVQDFAKKLVKELNSTDIKKVASTLTAAGNEKMKEEKAQEKGGKKTKAAKTKASVVVSRDTGNRADITAYDGDELDDDDFM
ncbi:eukaryotic translation initiation factor 3 subunit J [Helicocarpus griseus UAMH5409]|uniref:Eukaryotic translation initiation factor 3 subunit J n=1 Tax=Helicocarpus griseus UAMH5409 TaxID=1447875 RepID=A0A2B7X465_9EURO|nr:eukaryotic translation initiation factor 3 subunit J [Helicocarpus griseus UAMH5409]